MAKRKPIVIDGKVSRVDDKSTLVDVLPEDVRSVTTHGGELIPREKFTSVPVPEGFDTNLSRINKG